MVDAPQPAPVLRPDDDRPDEGMPAWQTVEEFHAECEREDAEIEAGVVWPDQDIVAELLQRAEDLRAEIASRGR